MVQMSGNAQKSFEEGVLDDPDLLDKLEQWSGENEEKKNAAKKANKTRDFIKARLEEKELSPGEYRLGGFKVVVKETESKHVEFTTEPKRQIQFRLSAK